MDKSFRCVQISRNPLNNFGGVEKVASRIHFLVRHKHCITTFSLWPKSYKPDMQACCQGEILVRSFDILKCRLPINPVSVACMLWTIFKSDLLLLHSPDPFSSLIACLSVFLPRTKVLIYWHADVNYNSFLGRLLYLLNYWALVASSLVVTTSPKLRKESSILRLFFQKTRVQSLFYTPASDPLQYTGYFDRFYDCVYVGRIASYKNLGNLLDSFFESSATSLAIGGAGPDLALFQKIANAKMISTPGKEVYFLGTLTDSEKYSLIANSRIFILSSVKSEEAFAIVQVEAMSVGTPVLSYDIPGSGVSWVNSDGCTGFTPYHLNRNHSPYINLLLSPSRWERFSSNCLKRSALFTQDRFDVGFSEILLSLSS